MATKAIPKDTTECLVSLMGMSDNLSFMETLIVKRLSGGTGQGREGKPRGRVLLKIRVSEGTRSSGNNELSRLDLVSMKETRYSG